MDRGPRAEPEEPEGPREVVAPHEADLRVEVVADLGVLEPRAVPVARVFDPALVALVVSASAISVSVAA